jgi:glycosyltransferase involved in cell wall biosynthesis
MRILYLLYAQQNSFSDSGDNPGSKFPWSEALMEALAGYDNLNIALAVPVNGKSFQKQQVKGITLYGLPNPREKNFLKKIYKRIKHAPEDINVNSYAVQAINDFNPDIIQIFGTENPFGLIIPQQRIPVVIHIQGYLMVCGQKWFTGISKCDQLRYTGLKDLLLMNGSYHEFFEFRNRAEREDAIIKSCSYFMGRTTFDNRIVSLISPGSKYFHCEEFIRKNFFREKWNATLTDQISLVSILKGTTYKGIDLLIETLLVLKKYSALKFSLTICGVAEAEEVVRILKKKYKKDIADLNISFAGRQTADGLAKQLCNSNFYIHPSYIENSPNSVCEAMALGMPVISTNVGGICSLMDDGVDGLLVQEGEPYSLAAAVINLINNYEYAKLLGENARKRSVGRHAPDQIVKQLLSIYETILTENGGN